MYWSDCRRLADRPTADGLELGAIQRTFLSVSSRGTVLFEIPKFPDGLVEIQKFNSIDDGHTRRNEAEEAREKDVKVREASQAPWW
jgi:hypothetical protein